MKTLIIIAVLAFISTNVIADQKWVTCQKGYGKAKEVRVFPDHCPSGWWRV